MTRPTYVYTNTTALLHNIARVKQCAPGKQIVAMIKANAYGCALNVVVPTLEGHVDAFGVASLEEAQKLRALGSRSACILFQGVFSADELSLVTQLDLQLVVHHAAQVRWIKSTPLASQIKIWVKVDTGMHRLGFAPEDLDRILMELRDCPWVDRDLGLMTHMACAHEPQCASNQAQWQRFMALPEARSGMRVSIANSATIIAFPMMQGDVVRPGMMLYGASPFPDKTAYDLGLRPVMHFMSAISAIHDYPIGTSIGYGAAWTTSRPSRIAVVPVGYGDGYPRHILPGTPVWTNHCKAPIVGRVSMDMMTIDVTDCPQACIGDPVELWGERILVETVAHAAGTIPYELLCQVSPRVHRRD